MVGVVVSSAEAVEETGATRAKVSWAKIEHWKMAYLYKYLRSCSKNASAVEIFNQCAEHHETLVC